MGNKFTFVFFIFVFTSLSVNAFVCDAFSKAVTVEGGSECQCLYPEYAGAELKSYEWNTATASEYINYCPKETKKVTVRLCPDNTVEVPGTIKIQRISPTSPDLYETRVCRCKYIPPGGDDVPQRNSYSADLNPCEDAPKTSAATTSSFSCKEVEELIESCREEADRAGESCDVKSDKTATMQNTINGTAAQITAALANSGSADSCSKAGLLSSTAGYGAGMLATDCKKDFDSCKKKCGNNFDQYTDSSVIANSCNDTQAVKDSEDFKRYVEGLAQRAVEANDTCASTKKQTTAQTFLTNSVNSAGRFAELSQTSARCANAISGKASVVPLTLTCAMGTGTNCPVNCVSNPGDASCKTVSGTASQLAAIASKPNQYIPAGFGSGKVPTGGVGLGNIDLGSDDSAASGAQPVADAESAALFASAAQANAGGGGSTSASDKKDKAGSGGEATEDKGFFGGTFSAMKNAVNRAIGGSGFFGGKNSSSSSADSKIDVTKKKSIIRGLANTGGATCYMDAKGSEFCFGRKNMDIFQMMNKQYGNQSKSFITGL